MASTVCFKSDPLIQIRLGKGNLDLGKCSGKKRVRSMREIPGFLASESKEGRLPEVL